MVYVGPLLQELDERLQKNSLSARKVFDSLKEILGTNDNIHQIALIENSLGRLDYKEAREHFAQLKQELGIELKS